MDVSRLLITSDLYKVDDRQVDRLPNPQALNIRWLTKLLGEMVGRLAQKDVTPIIEFAYPDPASRVAVYRSLFREFSSEGWAALYDEVPSSDLRAKIAARFQDALVLSFEAPPYLIAIFDEFDIPYIDFTTHPIRFLADYVFGVRSNVDRYCERLEHLALDPESVFDCARVSAARSARIIRDDQLPPGSAVFFGQIKIDASLIDNGVIAGENELRAALGDLRRDFSHVFYKPHPYLEDPEGMQALVTDMGAVWLDMNAYDVLGAPNVSMVASLSSGTLYEAQFFAMPQRRFLGKRKVFAGPEAFTAASMRAAQYVPVSPSIMQAPAWRYILGLSNDLPDVVRFDPSVGALKFSLNMKWGR